MSSIQRSDEFYIGYQKRMPAGLRWLIVRLALGIGVAVPAVMFALAAGQSPADRGTFEFGRQRTFEGVLRTAPLPYLRTTENGVTRTFVVVGAGKHGIPETARAFDGEFVRFTGSLIYRDNLAMIELSQPETIEVIESRETEARTRFETIGPIELTGEIVDTKCYLGVMRPAVGKVHRACAARCLSGGVPPGLLVRDNSGETVAYMLVGENGESVNIDPEWAALFARVSGILEIQDDVPIIRVKKSEIIGQ